MRSDRTRDVLLRASTEFEDFVKATESSLTKLGIAHTRNRTQNLVEFEIDSPVYFRIVIESRSDPVIHNNPILPSISKAKGSNVDLRFGLDANEEETLEATRAAGSVMREVVSMLGKEPWSDLGYRQSGREKKKWLKFLH